MKMDERTSFSNGPPRWPATKVLGEPWTFHLVWPSRDPPVEETGETSVQGCCFLAPVPLQACHKFHSPWMFALCFACVCVCAHTHLETEYCRIQHPAVWSGWDTEGEREAGAWGNRKPQLAQDKRSHLDSWSNNEHWPQESSSTVGSEPGWKPNTDSAAGWKVERFTSKVTNMQRHFLEGKQDYRAEREGPARTDLGLWRPWLSAEALTFTVAGMRGAWLQPGQGTAGEGKAKSVSSFTPHSVRSTELLPCARMVEGAGVSLLCFPNIFYKSRQTSAAFQRNLEIRELLSVV